MEMSASLIPRLGLVVVGALCLDIVQSLLFEFLAPGCHYHAMIPLSGSEARRGSRMTPSVFVLQGVVSALL